MHFAASNGDLNLIKALISKNVPLSSLHQESGLNCLMTALLAKKIDLLK